MKPVTLDKIYEDIISLKDELKEIKNLLSEGDSELTEKTKKLVEVSRKRNDGEFISQDEIEKRFL